MTVLVVVIVGCAPGVGREGGLLGRSVPPMQPPASTYYDTALRHLRAFRIVSVAVSTEAPAAVAREDSTCTIGPLCPLLVNGLPLRPASGSRSVTSGSRVQTRYCRRSPSSSGRLTSAPCLILSISLELPTKLERPARICIRPGSLAFHYSGLTFHPGKHDPFRPSEKPRVLNTSPTVGGAEGRGDSI